MTALEISFFPFILPTIVGIIFCIYFVLYKINRLKQIFPDKLNKILEKELYINNLYNIIEKYIYSPYCEVLSFIDKFIIGGFSKLIGLITKICSVLITKIQTGSVQSYIICSLLGIILALSFVAFYYFKLKGF